MPLLSPWFWVNNLITKWDNKLDLDLNSILPEDQEAYELNWDNLWTIIWDSIDITVNWTNFWTIICKNWLLSVSSNEWTIFCDEFWFIIEDLDLQVYREYWEQLWTYRPKWVHNLIPKTAEEISFLLENPDFDIDQDSKTWPCHEIIIVTNWTKLKFDLIRDMVIANNQEIDPIVGEFDWFRYTRLPNGSYKIINKWQIIYFDLEIIKVQNLNIKVNN